MVPISISIEYSLWPRFCQRISHYSDDTRLLTLIIPLTKLELHKWINLCMIWLTNNVSK